MIKNPNGLHDLPVVTGHVQESYTAAARSTSTNTVGREAHSMEERPRMLPI